MPILYKIFQRTGKEIIHSNQFFMATKTLVSKLNKYKGSFHFWKYMHYMESSSVLKKKAKRKTMIMIGLAWEKSVKGIPRLI